MGYPFGRYELIKRLAAGGMGEVFLGRQSGVEGFEKLLVVKVMLRHLAENAEFVEMFLDEGRLTARLNHPNIAQVFDLGKLEEVEGPLLYMVMEYVHGEDVQRVWKAARKKNLSLPIPLAVRIAADAAAGLHHAHQIRGADGELLQIVHRDVAPQNVVVSFDGVVKLIDFGVAYAAGRATQTAAGSLKGKYAFMSPEQAASDPVDHRSDIFSLGVMLYNLTLSMRLFRRDVDALTLSAVLECKVPPPTSVMPSFDPQLEAILLKALAKNRDDRFTDAQEFQRALEEWLSSTQQQGSTLHLAAFMREVYSERLKDETPTGLSRTATPFGGRRSISAVVEAMSRVTQPVGASPPRPEVLDEPSHPWPESGSEVVAPPTTALDPVTELAQPTPSAPVVVSNPLSQIRRRRRRRNYKLAIGVGVAVLALAIYFLFSDSPEPEPVSAPTLAVRSRPAGADVVLDGRRIGRTPLQGQVLAAGKKVNVAVSLAGYTTVREEVTAVGNQTLDVTLDPLPVPAPPPAPVAANPEPPVQPPPPPRPPPKPAPEVSFNLSTRPNGAAVFLRGAMLGVTPLTVHRAKSNEKLQFQFKLKGFLVTTRNVEGGSDQDVRIILPRIPGSRPTARSAPVVKNDAAPEKAPEVKAAASASPTIRSVDEGKPMIRTLEDRRTAPTIKSVDSN